MSNTLENSNTDNCKKVRSYCRVIRTVRDELNPFSTFLEKSPMRTARKTFKNSQKSRYIENHDKSLF
jgi:SRSO17 transposase